jgi:hypothetical protein
MPGTDRITEVLVRFESGDGKIVLLRSYKMDPANTYIKANNPQGMVPGSLELHGPVTSMSDKGAQR